jgi:N-acetylmuramoyl-L-alanine amidase
VRRSLFVLAALVLSGACAAAAKPRTLPATTTTSSRPAPPVLVPTSTTTVSAPPVTALPTTTTTAVVLGPPAPANATVVATSNGVVVPVVSHSGSTFTVTTPCQNQAKVDSAFTVGPVDVVLDPGHGGDGEKGAIGPNGLTEAAVNLAVAQLTKADLEASGLRVALTRTGDYMMTLTARTTIVKNLHPRVFVSIHHNADPDGPHDGPGTETYYQLTSTDSKRLAGLVWEDVHNVLSQYKIAWVGDTDAGTKYRRGSTGDDYYAVLRQTHGVTSALAELSFISDPPEAALLARPDVQHVEADGVALGILRYLNTSNPGAGFVEPYPRTDPPPSGEPAPPCVDPPLT